MKRVVIVGGGVTGLTAAYDLQERARAAGEPVEYLLVESCGRLGGKILTEKTDGFLIDAGPDAFLAERASVFELSARLGLDDHLLRTNDENRGTFVFTGGRLHRLPEGLALMVPTRIAPFLASPLISWPGKLRMALDLILPPAREDVGDESLAAFVRRRLGEEALEKIAEPLIASIHGGDPETMSLRAAFPRFLEMERAHGSLIRAMLARRGAKGEGRPPGGAGPRRTYFMSFREGMSELTEALTSRLDPSRIILNRAVKAISKRPPEAAGFTVHLDGDGSVEADAVIVTTPADRAAPLLGEIDGEAAGLLGQTPFTSTATVSLAFRGEDIPRPLEGFGFIVPTAEGRRIKGATHTSRKWDHRAPEDGSVLLRVFLGGARNRGVVFLDDDEMLAAVREELGDILGITAPPILSRIYRWVDAMPQYTVGHLERMAAVSGRLRRHGGLVLAGGSYHGIGIGHCIDSATRAVNDVLA